MHYTGFLKTLFFASGYLSIVMAERQYGMRGIQVEPEAIISNVLYFL